MKLVFNRKKKNHFPDERSFIRIHNFFNIYIICLIQGMKFQVCKYQTNNIGLHNFIQAENHLFILSEDIIQTVFFICYLIIKIYFLVILIEFV